MSGNEFLDEPAEAAGEVSHRFAPEVEPLAHIMFNEMQYLWVGDRKWEELSESERSYFSFVIERILVEKELILGFFANHGDV